MAVSISKVSQYMHRKSSLYRGSFRAEHSSPGAGLGLEQRYKCQYMKAKSVPWYLYLLQHVGTDQSQASVVDEFDVFDVVNAIDEFDVFDLFDVFDVNDVFDAFETGSKVCRTVSVNDVLCKEQFKCKCGLMSLRPVWSMSLMPSMQSMWSMRSMNLMCSVCLIFSM